MRGMVNHTLWRTSLSNYSINLYIIFDSATSLSDYFSQFVQALTCDLKVVSSSPSEISTFFFISMRNLIKIYFTYTTKHYEFRFFFRTVTLLCFLKWFTSIYINTPKCPILQYHLKFKKKMFKEYWYIHIGRSWKILYYWNSILFCENKIETNIRHALFLFSA